MSQEQFNKYKDFCNKIISSTELHDGSDYDKTCGMCIDLIGKVWKADWLRPRCLERHTVEDAPRWFTVITGEPLEDRDPDGAQAILFDETLKFEDIPEEVRQVFDCEDKEEFLGYLFGGVFYYERPFDLEVVADVICCLKDDSEAHNKWRIALVKAMLDSLEFAIKVQLRCDEEDFKDYITLSGRRA